ncbi:MAG: membrane integrity-associated transporter subunit PqiC [Xanthomonadaceae bacterium]|nr:membrane integrity-associated transporter subunit PqiC [Xanthomonadaceae bacterium]MDE1959170.1 membrane integrity-associated transporter subunit PqiC [Xanthomonadaceae bacterium]MDE2176815.1 membrane integrity-associated transporter subunit PqiC [Xanthomonadaceae bacterium]MDE2244989.1 membrane integrity-associated transporter subunit PqiC [Xanthomonadaceae bacterium]
MKRLPLLLVALLSGCASLIAPPGHEDVFLLPAAPAPTQMATAVPLPWSLTLTTPSASGPLASRALLVSPQPDQVQVYAGARWAEPPPTLLRQRLVAAFAADGRVPRVVPDSVGALTRYTLSSDLDDFRVLVSGGQARVRVMLTVRLLDNPTRQLLAQRSFTIEEPAAGRNAPQVVAAFGAACNRLAPQVVDWTIASAGAPAPVAH